MVVNDMLKEEDILNECGHRTSERVEALKKLPSSVCPACLLERIKELEADIAKRPAKPLFGEARSLLLKAMDNSAYVDDAIEKYKKLKERIKKLKEILTEYGRHHEGCSAQFNTSHSKYCCRCGWDRERKQIPKG
jgi:hypothetical protein